jgi:hypothetical protein
VSIRIVVRLILYKAVLNSFYYENHTNKANTLLGQNAGLLNATAGSIHSYN